MFLALFVSFLDESLDMDDMKEDFELLRKNFDEMRNNLVERKVESLAVSEWSNDKEVIESLPKSNGSNNYTSCFDSLRELLIAFFVVFVDEEFFMDHYNISNSHKKSHFQSHAAILLKLENLSFKILNTWKQERKGYVFIYYKIKKYICVYYFY
jgi:hypothetical protein